MSSRLGKAIFAIAAGVACTHSAAAAPVSLRAFAQQRARLESLAYAMSTRSRNVCADPEMLTGLVLHDLSEYDEAVRPAVSRAFSLNGGIGVMQIVQDSAAAGAGLQVDDEILAINDRSIVARPQATRKSFSRMDGFNRLLQSVLSSGPVELLVRRSGALLRVRLRGEPGCGGKLSLISSNDRNAWSDGTQVVVTTAMMALAKDDDEIAFVIAHEMAHNILGHAHSSSAGIFGLGLGVSKSRRNELDADQFAVKLMSAAGYRGEAGVSFLQTVQRRYWWNLSLDHPGFGSRIRAVNAALASLSVKRLAGLAAKAPLSGFRQGNAINADARPLSPPQQWSAQASLASAGSVQPITVALRTVGSGEP